MPRRPVRAVVDGVHARHHGEQHLRGADVGGRLLTADVLLAGLQREAVGRGAVGVDRHADEAPGQGPLAAPGARTCSRRAGRRSPSGTPNRWVVPTATSAPHSPGGVARVSASRSAAAVTSAPASWAASARARWSSQPAVGRGVLDEDAEHLGAPGGRAQRVGGVDAATGRRRRPGGRAARRGSARRRGSAGRPARRRAGRRRPGPSSERRMSVIASAAAVPSSSSEAPAVAQAGEVADDGLEVQQRLEPALGDLGLVRRVGGVPGRVLEDVALDDRRGEGAVVAEPDQRGEHAVAGGDLAQLGRRRPPRTRPARRRGRRRSGCRRGRRCRRGPRGTRARRRRASRRARPRRGPMWRPANSGRVGVLTRTSGADDAGGLPLCRPVGLQRCLSRAVPCA